MLDANSLDIASYALFKAAGFKLAGKVGGNFEMNNDTGKGRLWLKGVTSRDLKIKGFAIPDLDFDKGWLEADIKGDRMTIRKMELEGKELKVRMTGDLVLRAAHGGPEVALGARLRPGDPVEGFHAAPIAHGEDPGGLLALRKPGGAPLDEDEARLVDSIAAQAAMAVANARLHQKMVRLSERDALTGAHNRRSLFARLDLELERSARFEHAMAVALVDVDRFRQYNDAFGHPAGDAILRTVAGILGRSVRKVDLVARYGGEEFAVMLARADRPAALAAAEALRAAVHAANIPHGASEAGRVTISVGIGVFPEDGRDLGALIDAADAALYAAKRAGRNAVRAHEAGMRTHPGRRRDVKVTADAEAGG